MLSSQALVRPRRRPIGDLLDAGIPPPTNAGLTDVILVTVIAITALFEGDTGFQTNSPVRRRLASEQSVVHPQRVVAV
jgi:hypothetical protein